MVLLLEAVPGTGDVLDACGEGYWPVDVPPVSTLHYTPVQLEEESCASKHWDFYTETFL